MVSYVDGAERVDGIRGSSFGLGKEMTGYVDHRRVVTGGGEGIREAGGGRLEDEPARWPRLLERERRFGR